jgi:hypothetical protein
MAIKNFLSRCCPVCGHNPPMTNLVSTEKKAEDSSLDQLTQYWNGFFKEKVLFSYARCDGCGLLYCPTFFNNEQLEILYGQMPANMDEVPLQALKNTQYGYFSALKQHSPLNGGFLEIGPDIGLFTEHCVREGEFNEYWLFEPNRVVKTVLEGVVQGHKSHIIHEMTDFSAVPDHAVSAAVIIHVMDHLLDPVSTLTQLRTKLASGARLLIVTHDESSMLRKIFAWRWPAFCLQHPQIYNPKTTQALLEASGYEVVAQQKTVNHFKISFLLKHALWAMGIKVKSVPSFNDITVGLKLGNILTIATPKEGITHGK